eukprot:Hpha_TRINITY_DN17590_c0_g1::TRINITY_DN17590_c0_g1_i1::g.92423::m.92423
MREGTLKILPFRSFCHPPLPTPPEEHDFFLGGGRGREGLVGPTISHDCIWGGGRRCSWYLSRWECGNECFAFPDPLAWHVSEPGLSTSVLRQKVPLELADEVDNLGHIVLWRQNGGSEVESAWTLTETGAGNDDDPSSPKEVHAPHRVRGHLPGTSGFDRARRKVQGGEGVHRPVNGLATDPGNLIQTVDQPRRTACHALKDGITLPAPTIVACVTRLRPLEHQLYHQLPTNIRTEGYTGELEQHVHHFLGKINALHITTPTSALAGNALGGTVERNERETLKFGVRPGDLLEGNELLALPGSRVDLVDVRLVDLVGEHEEVVLLGEEANVEDLLLRQHSSGGVARVDDAQSPHFLTRPHGLVVSTLELGQLEGPPRLLVEVVRSGLHAEHRETRRVQRVLREGDHEGRLLASTTETLQHSLNSRTRSVREENVLSPRGHATVTLLNVLRDSLPHELVPPRVRVRSGAVGVPDLLHDRPRAGHNV